MSLGRLLKLILPNNLQSHAFQKVLKERGIDKMVKEARDDNRENDAEHMRPVSPLPLHLRRATKYSLVRQKR